MNYYICEKCGTLYCGWAEGTICGVCGRKLKKVSREYYSEKKEIVIEGGGLEGDSDTEV